MRRTLTSARPRSAKLGAAIAAIAIGLTITAGAAMASGKAEHGHKRIHSSAPHFVAGHGALYDSSGTTPRYGFQDGIPPFH